MKKCRPARRPGWASTAPIAVIEMEEVLLARMQSFETVASRSKNNLRLACRSSTIASMTRPQSARSDNCAAAESLAEVSCAACAVSLPFSVNRFNWATMPCTAWAAAPGRLSKSLTGWPALAATCAMPAPIAPAPMTAIGVELERAALMIYWPVNLGARFSMKAATPSA